MTFIRASVIFVLFILLSVDASYDEAVKFLHNDLENATTESCSKMAASRDAFLKDVANNIKSKAYIEDLINHYKTQDKFGRELAKFELPFIIDDTAFMREYDVATSALTLENDEMLRQYVEALVKMEVNYNTAKVCPYQKPHCILAKDGLSLSEIEDIMAKSRNVRELLHLWVEWRFVTSDLKGMFEIVRKLEKHFPVTNISHLIEIEDITEARSKSKSFELYTEVLPLYSELHKYVYRKLKKHYGSEASGGKISAHILGNMWAKNWYHIEPLVRPFPNVGDGNLEANMKEHFKVEDIFKVGDNFFQSMGLLPMGEAYKAPDSMLTKPKDGRAVACYPNSADFCNGTYRVTLCGKVDLENFIDIFRELGHVQYFMQYKDLPFYMRNSPSSAFHKTIGEAVALSATSPQHLKKLNLLTDYRDTYESSINFLMKMALLKVAFLPFGLMVGRWQWEVGYNMSKTEWNSNWWKFRKSTLLRAPVLRSDRADFDPVSFNLVAMNGDAKAYYFADLMEFQIYKALCLKTGEYNPSLSKICPLHDCNFYNSKEAGKILGDVLRLGALKPWPEVLEMLTGSRKVLSGPLLEYFQPLYDFLKKENREASKIPVIHDHHLEPPHTIMTINVIFFSALIFVLVIVWYKCGLKQCVMTALNRRP